MPTGPPPGRVTGARGRTLPLWLALLLLAVLWLVRSWVTGGGGVTRAELPRAVQDAVLATYAPSEDTIGEPTFVRDGAPAAADRGTHEALWAEWTDVIPPYWTRRVGVFEIASDGTGPGTFAAYVAPLDGDGDSWVLAVDPADAAENPEYYHETLVHELAHVFTLGAGRVELATTTATLGDRTAACGGPAVGLGCAAQDSLLAAFVDRFWTAEDIAAADSMEFGTAGFEQQLLGVYARDRSRWVSPYAASAPEEDIAETFVALVMGQRQTSGSVAEQKVEMLRADAELFALADRIRAALRDG